MIVSFLIEFETELIIRITPHRTVARIELHNYQIYPRMTSSSSRSIYYKLKLIYLIWNAIIQHNYKIVSRKVEGPFICRVTCHLAASWSSMLPAREGLCAIFYHFDLSSLSWEVLCRFTTSDLMESM